MQGTEMSKCVTFCRMYESWTHLKTSWMVCQIRDKLSPGPSHQQTGFWHNLENVNIRDLSEDLNDFLFVASQLKNPNVYLSLTHLLCDIKLPNAKYFKAHGTK